MATTSSAITQGIKVSVASQFVPERSDPRRQTYFFIYHITITNEGEAPAQLVSRHWIITNADGDEEHVRGPGVVGETPYLEPGTGFQYTSACPLPSPIGSMRGTFQMRRDDGTHFDAEVAIFTLAAPHVLN